MKVYIHIILISLIINTVCIFTQPSGWIQQNSGTNENLNSIHFQNLSTGWAAGSNGKIFKTTNGGASWLPLSTGITGNLHAINFTSALTGFAGGDGGKILKTTNGGTTWTQIQTYTQANINSIDFVNAVTGIAACSGGVILRTTSNGEYWTSIAGGTTANLTSVCASAPASWWIVGETGKILKSTNTGTTWSVNVDLGTTCNLYSVYFPSVLTGYITGSYTAYGQQFVFVYNTQSAGEWWYYQYSGMRNVLRSVYFINNTTGVAVGDSGRIVGTINGGTNWVQQWNSKTNNLYSICFGSNKAAWVCGSNGLIMITGSAGFFDTLSTSRRDIGVMPLVKDAAQLKNAKYRIVFRTPDTSYNIIRSLNNGASFDTLYSHITLRDTGKEFDGMIVRVFPIRSGVPYNNNSINYGVVKDPGTKSIDTIQTRLPGWDYFPVQNCYVEGSKYLHSIARPWQSVSMSVSYPYTGTYNNIGSKLKPHELRNVKIVFTGMGSGQMAYRYLVTSPATYVYQEMKPVPFKVYEIDATDATPQPRQLNCAFLEFPAADSGHPDGIWNPTAEANGGKELLYIFGSNYSSSPDTAYTLKNLLLSIQIDVMYVWSPKLKAQGLTYHINDEFIIYPYTVTRPEIEPGYPLIYEFVTHSPIAVQNISSEIPKNYLLLQNYPNPFNPSTKIRFDVISPLYPLLAKERTGRSPGVVLKIYDILGRVVTTLVNEPLKPGTYEVEWNASTYSSGVYFYQLQVNDYLETKKMVLLK